MTKFYFAAVETEEGPRAELKIATPYSLAADVFDPSGSFEEYEAKLDSALGELERTREEARAWFAKHAGSPAI
ncbi:hypothetical protein [Methylosinus sp. Sm6]|uniref:hypothetical protein n=1 Tax=Methylosinus sp. Sm6 TaxID=2866948 RepID=UPI001C99EEED|nr:hypothetical protein [Methylosinus sp. Sm6]MBY6240776.1 hypothetical protein [Methylosinus sp. Sm6]